MVIRNFSLRRSGIRERGKIAWNASLMFIHPFPHCHHIFLFVAFQLSSQKQIFLDTKNIGFWGASPPPPTPKLRLWIHRNTNTKSEILTALLLNTEVFCDVTPCWLVSTRSCLLASRYGVILCNKI